MTHPSFAPLSRTLRRALVPCIAALTAAPLAAGCVAAGVTGDLTDPAGSADPGDPGEHSAPGNPSNPGDPSAGPPRTAPVSDTPDDPDQLFPAWSPWNSLAIGGVDPASATMVTGSGTGSLAAAFATTGQGLDITGTDDYPDYGIPLYVVGPGVTPVRVSDRSGLWGAGFASVPIPANAAPSVGTDHHLSIWDTAHHALYEFWTMQRASDGTWSADAGVVFDTRGAGFQTTLWSLSARGYGGAAIAGSIRRDELQRGVIAHALAIAYPGARGLQYAAGLGADGKTLNIASHADNVADAKRNTASNIPEGARLRLKASVDVAARCNGNRACAIIGTALQTYGAYMVDKAGVPTLYAEVLTGRSATWSGLLHRTDARVWLATDFELLALPALLTATPH